MKSSITLIGLALAVALAPQALAAGGSDWDIDSTHSSAQFSVRHMMVSNLPGQMSGVSGKVEFDGKNVDSIKVAANIDPSTINTNDQGRDEHLRGKDFFDVKAFPTIAFESTGKAIPANGGFLLPGKLTLHGVTRNVQLNVDGPTASFKDTKKGIERIGASATTIINRQDFGISYNSALDHGGVAIGDDVKITLNLEMRRKLAEKISSK